MEDLSEKVIRDLGRGNSKRKGPECPEESKEASMVRMKPARGRW